MSKEDVRKEKLSERLSMPSDTVAERSRAIKERLDRMPEFSNAKTVFIYVSAKNEVSTSELIGELLRSGKRVLVPVCDIARKQLIASELRDVSELRAGKLGIPEPAEEFVRPADAGSIDISVIPGTAFDEAGNRLGYGHGYYDKFLCQTKAPVVALAYEFQIVGSMKPDIYDVRANKIVTEKRVIECG